LEGLWKRHQPGGLVVAGVDVDDELSQGKAQPEFHLQMQL